MLQSLEQLIWRVKIHQYYVGDKVRETVQNRFWNPHDQIDKNHTQMYSNIYFTVLDNIKNSTENLLAKNATYVQIH